MFFSIYFRLSLLPLSLPKALSLNWCSSLYILGSLFSPSLYLRLSLCIDVLLCVLIFPLVLIFLGPLHWYHCYGRRKREKGGLLTHYPFHYLVYITTDYSIRSRLTLSLSNPSILLYICVTTSFTQKRYKSCWKRMPSLDLLLWMVMEVCMVQVRMSYDPLGSIIGLFGNCYKFLPVLYWIS